MKLVQGGQADLYMVDHRWNTLSSRYSKWSSRGIMQERSSKQAANSSSWTVQSGLMLSQLHTNSLKASFSLFLPVSTSGWRLASQTLPISSRVIFLPVIFSTRLQASTMDLYLFSLSFPLRSLRRSRYETCPLALYVLVRQAISSSLRNIFPLWSPHLKSFSSRVPCLSASRQRKTLCRKRMPYTPRSVSRCFIFFSRVNLLTTSFLIRDSSNSCSGEDAPRMSHRFQSVCEREGVSMVMTPFFSWMRFCDLLLTRKLWAMTSYSLPKVFSQVLRSAASHWLVISCFTSTVSSAPITLPVASRRWFGSGCSSIQIVLKLFLSMKVTSCSRDTFEQRLIELGSLQRQMGLSIRRGFSRMRNCCPKWILLSLKPSFAFALSKMKTERAQAWIFFTAEMLQDCSVLEVFSKISATQLLEHVPRNPYTFPLNSITWSPNLRALSLEKLSDAQVKKMVRFGSSW